MAFGLGRGFGEPQLDQRQGGGRQFAAGVVGFNQDLSRFGGLHGEEPSMRPRDPYKASPAGYVPRWPRTLYRIIETRDGRVRVQFRFLLIWRDCAFTENLTLWQAIAYVRARGAPVRLVWP
jgi:hypothetical protein